MTAPFPEVATGGSGFDVRGLPQIFFQGELPEISPPGAAWMLAGSGGVAFPEYGYAVGLVVGGPGIGIRWKARVLSVGQGDQELDVSGWSVSAALFEADGTPVAALDCSVVDAKNWIIAEPAFSPGPKRAMIVQIVAQKPGLITYLKTPTLLLVAAS